MNYDVFACSNCHRCRSQCRRTGTRIPIPSPNPIGAIYCNESTVKVGKPMPCFGSSIQCNRPSEICSGASIVFKDFRSRCIDILLPIRPYISLYKPGQSWRAGYLSRIKLLIATSPSSQLLLRKVNITHNHSVFIG